MKCKIAFIENNRNIFHSKLLSGKSILPQSEGVMKYLRVYKNDPMSNFREYQKWNKREFQEYKGDLEGDFLRFLGQVQRLAKEPIEIEVNFRK